MKLGVFTALLSQLPLDDMLKKLTSLDIHSVELGTGNYAGADVVPGKSIPKFLQPGLVLE